jgi:hypothetical protein
MPEGGTVVKRKPFMEILRDQSGGAKLRSAMVIGALAAIAMGFLALGGTNHTQAGSGTPPGCSAAGLNMDISGTPGPLHVGDVITYTMSIQPGDLADGVCKKVNVDADLFFPDGSSIPILRDEIIQPDDPDFTCPGDARCQTTGPYQYTIQKADLRGPLISCSANTYEPTPPSGGVVTARNTMTAQSLTAAGNAQVEDCNSWPVTVNQPNIRVEKTAEKVLLPGNDAIFTVTVSADAAGTGTSENVTLTDQLPKGGTVSGQDAIDAGCDGPVAPAGKLTCNFGTLSPGDTRTITINVPTTEANCPDVENTATVSATFDSDLTDNTDSATAVINGCGKPDVVKRPTLYNLWLCNQGGDLCDNKESGVETVNIPLYLDDPIPSREPKCPTPVSGENTCPFQTLGAFEFEVRYNAKYLNVDVIAGSLWRLPDDGGFLNPLRDEVDCTSLHFEGIVQFRCITKGKPEAPSGPGTLAILQVSATADVYSILIANQENGIATQLINQDCQLSDLQGHHIKIDFDSCNDSAVTIRYLEGDIHADCIVDVLDQQQIAFRWGSRLGNLLYNSRMDLEPSAPKKGDGDIDAKDLQFVYGRHGSTCKDPHPVQDPVDPKAKPPTPEQ